ncbi:uncharacterized protein RCH25_049222 [Pelodytes ibericus]
MSRVVFTEVFPNPEVQARRDAGDVANALFDRLLHFLIKYLGDIIQSPKSIIVQPGKSAPITCSVKSHEGIEGIYLKNLHSNILFVYKDDNVTKNREYETRLSFSGTVSHFTTTLHNLTKNDNGLYLCEGLKSDPICGDGTLIFVGETCTTGETNFNTYSIVIMVILFVSILVLVIVNIYQKRRHCYSQVIRAPQNIVYEDMTQTIRRNTMGYSNCYTNS